MADSREPLDLALLFQRWVHSHEEDHDDTLVFRPSGFAFPPARGRRAMDLASGGAVRQARPGPADRRVLSTGRWQVEPPDQLVVHSESGAAERFQILALKADRLELCPAKGATS